MDAPDRRRIHEAIVRLADGDRSAFSLVFDELWPRVLRFVQRALAGRPEAEDLAQQALLKLFARIAEFDATRDGVAWAFGIVAYEIRTLRRQEQRRREVPHEGGIEQITDTRQSPETLAIQSDLARALTEALGELSASDRDILLPADEAGGAGGALQRKRRQRALERLRTVWRRLHA
jgi:RNA polymerase sigma-70 factor, ECF subfamily